MIRYVLVDGGGASRRSATTAPDDWPCLLFSWMLHEMGSPVMVKSMLAKLFNDWHSCSTTWSTLPGQKEIMK